MRLNGSTGQSLCVCVCVCVCGLDLLLSRLNGGPVYHEALLNAVCMNVVI